MTELINPGGFKTTYGHDSFGNVTYVGHYDSDDTLVKEERSLHAIPVSVRPLFCMLLVRTPISHISLDLYASLWPHVQDERTSY